VLSASLVLLWRGSIAQAETAVNVPVGSRVYEDLERLEVKGLLPGAILSTRPISALEAARLMKEAEEAIEKAEKAIESGPPYGEGRVGGGVTGSNGLKPDGDVRGGDVKGGGGNLKTGNGVSGGRGYGRGDGVEAVMKRLRSEFEDDASGVASGTYIKPIDASYMKFLYGHGGDGVAANTVENNNGDGYDAGANLVAGFSSSMELMDSVSIYLNPEYRVSGQDTVATLHQGYAILNMSNIELLAGRDSVWWGSGYHGGLLMTNNAKPFDMAKITTTYPVVLPWFLGYLGLVKPTLMLVRLEEDRDYARANLLGMRVDMKPAPMVQIGLSRSIMFGGEGRVPLSLSDWADILLVSDGVEHAESPINGDQLAAIDASFVYVNRRKYLPFSGMKLYTEWGAEDSSGDKTPSGSANICGAYIDGPLWIRNADARVEWANTGRNGRYGPTWYEHAVYYSGYTHEGSVIGHHMGTDSQDLFVRLQYHLQSGLTIGVEADRERSGVHAENAITEWAAIDAAYGVGKASLFFGAGLEREDEAGGGGQTAAVWFKAVWRL
jgi:hypothetical protein